MKSIRYVMLMAAIALTAACSPRSQPVEIAFVATFDGAPVGCNSGGPPAMTDLRFYVHNLKLIDASGKFHNVQLDEGDWQSGNLALIDLEDGSGECVNGTAEMRQQVQGTVTGEQLRGLEFTLGVPFDRNHKDPLLATPPLGDADMHWHWRGGYKFLRAGLKNSDDSFWFHLGSTGCEGTIRNITGCNAPNRATVRLDDFSPGDRVSVNLAALVSDGGLHDGVPASCSSGPAEESCAAAFAAAGLRHATGEQPAGQSLFVESAAGALP